MKVYKEMASPELGVESSMIFPSAVMLAQPFCFESHVAANSKIHS